MDDHLHIVCLDVPYPPDYGGVFDLFYKLVALHLKGIKIHLHCFEYGRRHPDEVKKYCLEVNYYKRKTGLQSFSFRLPYTVNSRRDKKLLKNLLKDDYPVLLEGIHSTYFLQKNKLLNKKIFVRLHNVEFEYYRLLAKAETSLVKKWFFLHESRLLKKYEKEIANKAMIITVTKQDAEVYLKSFGATNVKYLPVFLPHIKVNRKIGKGNFCLYHGNLSVAENEKASAWLLKYIFNDIEIPFVIAGKNPSGKLKKLTAKNENACIVSNPADKQMNELISKAQINVLPSFNSTGIKIKLLNAIFNGRHCVVNAQTVSGTGLESVCYVEQDIASFKSRIVTLYNQLFTEDETKMRRFLLQKIYNNEANAEQLIQWIYYA